MGGDPAHRQLELARTLPRGSSAPHPATPAQARRPHRCDAPHPPTGLGMLRCPASSSAVISITTRLRGCHPSSFSAHTASMPMAIPAFMSNTPGPVQAAGVLPNRHLLELANRPHRVEVPEQQKLGCTGPERCSHVVARSLRAQALDLSLPRPADGGPVRHRSGRLPSCPGCGRLETGPAPLSSRPTSRAGLRRTSVSPYNGMVLS